jgi:hypothetical protein
MEKQYVFCEAGIEILNIILMNLKLQRVNVRWSCSVVIMTVSYFVYRVA